MDELKKTIDLLEHNDYAAVSYVLPILKAAQKRIPELEAGIRHRDIQRDKLFALGLEKDKRIAELEAENERLRSGEPTEFALHHENNDLKAKIAELEADRTYPRTD